MFLNITMKSDISLASTLSNSEGFGGFQFILRVGNIVSDNDKLYLIRAIQFLRNPEDVEKKLGLVVEPIEKRKD